MALGQNLKLYTRFAGSGGSGGSGEVQAKVSCCLCSVCVFLHDLPSNLQMAAICVELAGAQERLS